MRVVVAAGAVPHRRRGADVGRIDLAVTVADELPASTLRAPLFRRRLRLPVRSAHAFDYRRKPSSRTLPRARPRDRLVQRRPARNRRGLAGHRRRVRVSVPSFQSVGAAVDGTALLATVPAIVARPCHRPAPPPPNRRASVRIGRRHPDGAALAERAGRRRGAPVRARPRRSYRQGGEPCRRAHDRDPLVHPARAALSAASRG